VERLVLLEMLGCQELLMLLMLLLLLLST